MEFTKAKLDELVLAVNHNQDGFEDDSHSFDIVFDVEQYNKLIELGWNDNDFDCVDIDDVDDSLIYIHYYPNNADSYTTVPEVIEAFFNEIGIDIEAPCNG